MDESREMASSERPCWMRLRNLRAAAHGVGEREEPGTSRPPSDPRNGRPLPLSMREEIADAIARARERPPAAGRLTPAAARQDRRA